MKRILSLLINLLLIVTIISTALDNCLHTSGIVITDNQTLKEVGSDHLPIFVKTRVEEVE